MHTNDWKVGFSQVEIHLFLDGFLKVLKQIGCMTERWVSHKLKYNF